MKKSIISLSLAAIAAALLAGCSPDPAPETAAGPRPTAAPSAPVKGAVVAHRNAEGKLECPVMHAPIESEAQAVGYQDHEGKRYYFCCAACPEKFKADPAKYVNHEH